MLNNKTIAVVIPAYNEEKQIQDVIKGIPEFVDRIIVVNDSSPDFTAEKVKALIPVSGSSTLPSKNKQKSGNKYYAVEDLLVKINEEEKKLFPDSEIVQETTDSRLILINLKNNSGVGAAIAAGYKWAKDNYIDCTAVMAGDGQMDPDELESICNPVVFENIDYVKGDRLSHPSASVFIPRTRYIGNSILSILTKIASGYWHVTDTQTGYTAISNKALNNIKLYKIYPRYGMPNDMLVKLNVANCSLREIDIKPVYNIGEKSKMKVFKVIPKISFLLFKSFFKRIWTKYFIKSFHPLFILYHLGFLLLLLAIPYGIKLIVRAINGIEANPLTALAFAFLSIIGFQSVLFAMWMDIQDNERLNR
ncbi:MAG: glycosyltransferase family 2 protein [Bacteroidales bacterium]|nr:glycosyltransferase family 2 protein [Bacteroidales bacterium]